MEMTGRWFRSALRVLGRREVAYFFLYAVLGVQLAELVAVPIYLAIAEPAELRRTLARSWPLRERSFACDAELAARLRELSDRHAGPGWRIAQTDYQRLKYFADELQPLDLTGINDRSIAHRRVEGSVVWGKFSYAVALQRRPELWILGHQVEPHAAPREPLASRTLGEVLGRPALAQSYFGYAVEEQFVAPLLADYTAASLPACGGYFNFLIRRDLAEKARALGLLVAPAG